MDGRRTILILAGPNGAGKTTFARESMRAGRLMVQLIAELVARRESFAFETTLADKSYARHVPEWQAAGYTVKGAVRELG